MTTGRYAVIPELLFTGDGDNTESKIAVIVENGIIVSLCAETALSKDMRIIKLVGGTLLPGFIDAHVHAERWQLPLYLSCGITTIRDTGNDPEYILALKKSAEDPEEKSPSIYCCGPLLDLMPYSHEHISWGMESEKDIREAISVLKDSGFDYIKLYASLDQTKLAAGINEAKKQGLHVLAHIERSDLLLAALNEGIDEVEHLAGTPLPFSIDFLNIIVSSGVKVVPTQTVFEEVFNRCINSDSPETYLSSLPENLKEYWRVYGNNVSRNIDAVKYYCSEHRKYISELIKRKADMGIGTDSPCQWAMPGSSFITETKVFSECGMSNTDVIKLTASGNAALLGISDKTGRIRPGMNADMVFVAGNPLEDLDCLSKVKRIFRRGFEFDPVSLIETTRLCRPMSESLRNFSLGVSKYVNWRESSVYTKHMMK